MNKVSKLLVMAVVILAVITMSLSVNGILPFVFDLMIRKFFAK